MSNEKQYGNAKIIGNGVAQCFPVSNNEIEDIYLTTETPSLYEYTVFLNTTINTLETDHPGYINNLFLRFFSNNRENSTYASDWEDTSDSTIKYTEIDCTDWTTIYNFIHFIEEKVNTPNRPIRLNCVGKFLDSGGYSYSIKDIILHTYTRAEGIQFTLRKQTKILEPAEFPIYDTDTAGIYWGDTISFIDDSEKAGGKIKIWARKVQ